MVNNFVTDRKIIVSVGLSIPIIEQIDALRGGFPRSAYIRNLIEETVAEKIKQNQTK